MCASLGSSTSCKADIWRMGQLLGVVVQEAFERVLSRPNMTLRLTRPFPLWPMPGREAATTLVVTESVKAFISRSDHSVKRLKFPFAQGMDRR